MAATLSFREFVRETLGTLVPCMFLLLGISIWGSYLKAQEQFKLDNGRPHRIIRIPCDQGPQSPYIHSIFSKYHPQRIAARERYLAARASDPPVPPGGFKSMVLGWNDETGDMERKYFGCSEEQARELKLRDAWLTAIRNPPTKPFVWPEIPMEKQVKLEKGESILEGEGPHKPWDGYFWVIGPGGTLYLKKFLMVPSVPCRALPRQRSQPIIRPG